MGNKNRFRLSLVHFISVWLSLIWRFTLGLLFSLISSSCFAINLSVEAIVSSDNFVGSLSESSPSSHISKVVGHDIFQLKR